MNEIAYSFKRLQKILKNLPIKNGGLSSPKDCKSRHKVAIIVPYRNREQNLKIFLNNIHPFLVKQQIDYGIYLIEPIQDAEFNRGLLMNIGFLESLKLSENKWDCFILHDVDLVCIRNNRIFYILDCCFLVCNKNIIKIHLLIQRDRF